MLKRKSFILFMFLLMLCIPVANSSTYAAQLQPTINSIHASDTTVTGKFIRSYLIRVYTSGGGELGEGIVSSTGDFSVHLNYKLKTTPLLITYQQPYGSESHAIPVNVYADAVKPVAPTPSKPVSVPVQAPAPSNPAPAQVAKPTPIATAPTSTPVSIPVSKPTVPTVTTVPVTPQAPVQNKLPQLPSVSPITNASFIVSGKSFNSSVEIDVKIGSVLVSSGYSDQYGNFKVNLPVYLTPDTKLTITETNCRQNSMCYHSDAASSDVIVTKSNLTGIAPTFNSLQASNGIVRGNIANSSYETAYTIFNGKFYSVAGGSSITSPSFMLWLHTQSGIPVYLTFVRAYGQIVSTSILAK